MQIVDDSMSGYDRLSIFYVWCETFKQFDHFHRKYVFSFARWKHV